MKKKLNRRIALATVVLSSALATAGCANLATTLATYKPPQFPDKDVATIKMDPGSYYHLTIFKVDGVSLTNFTPMESFRESYFKEQKLFPGKRSVTVRFTEEKDSRTAFGFSTLTFDAKAGERYTIHEQHEIQARHENSQKRDEEFTFYTWITDASGAIVPQLKKGKVAP